MYVVNIVCQFSHNTGGHLHLMFNTIVPYWVRACFLFDIQSSRLWGNAWPCADTSASSSASKASRPLWRSANKKGAILVDAARRRGLVTAAGRVTPEGLERLCKELRKTQYICVRFLLTVKSESQSLTVIHVKEKKISK